MSEGNSKIRLGCTAILVFVGLMIVVSGIITGIHEREEAAKTPAQRAQEAADAEARRLASRTPQEVAIDETKLVKFSWHKSGFGSVMIANFTIRNNSQYDVKDLHIECEHSAPSGTVIDRNEETIYEIVKAHSTRVIRNVNMGFIASQAAGSSCEILGLSLVNEE